MNALKIIMSLTLLYYSFLISYALCTLLTPKKQFRHPRSLCFFLMALNLPIIWLYDIVISISIPLCVFFCILIFTEPWRIRIASATISYLVLVLVEGFAVNISSVLLTLITGDLVMISKETQSVPFRLFTYLCLAMTGLLFMKFIVSVIKQHFIMSRPRVLISLGLPLLLVNLSPYPLFLFKDSRYYFAVVFLLICCYTLMYIPLSWGIREFRHQELQKSQREQQYQLMQQQLSCAQELEKEYQEIRKWNHDISNHFISLSYFMESGKYEEAKEYLSRLIQQAES